MNLVDEKNRLRILRELLQHRFQPLLEIAAVLRAREQRAHVERIHLKLTQQLGDVAFVQAPRKPFGNGRLADTCFADQQRIVLATAAQHLDHALQLVRTTDQRIDLAVLGEMIEVDRIGIERALRFAGAFAFFFRFGRFFLLVLRTLGDPMRDVVDHVEASHAALVQEVNRVRLLLAEDRNQHVRTRHFFLARRLDVENCALNHALETLRGLRIGVRVSREARRMFADEIGEHTAQFFEIDSAGFEHFGCRRVVQHREQQVLDGDELVLFLPRFHEGHVQRDFQFLRNHDASSTCQTPAGNHFRRQRLNA